MSANAVIVRYRVKPDRVEENAGLVRAVYAELAELAPSGFRYSTTLLEDGETFVHSAIVEPGAEAPLPQLEAFQRFQENIEERCSEPPVVTRGSVVGSYAPGVS
jgi:hypothetical protein